MCILYIYIGLYRSLYMICSKVIIQYHFLIPQRLVSSAPLISTILWPQKTTLSLAQWRNVASNFSRYLRLRAEFRSFINLSRVPMPLTGKWVCRHLSFFFYTDQWMMLPRCWIEFDFKFWDPKFHKNRSSRRQQYPQQKDDALKLWERTEEASRTRMHPDVRHGVLLNFSDGQGRCNW